MPGIVIHLTSAPQELLESPLGRIGLLAPDMWKNEVPTKVDYEVLFRGIENAPSYEEVLRLCDEEHGGSHFGSKPRDSSHANFQELARVFEELKVNPANPFYIGYAHHLRTDFSFYSNYSLYNRKSFKRDLDNDRDSAVKCMHDDWAKTNTKVASLNPNVYKAIEHLPPETQESVTFSIGEAKYIYAHLLPQFVKKMQHYKTIEQIMLDNFLI